MPDLVYILKKLIIAIRSASVGFNVLCSAANYLPPAWAEFQAAASRAARNPRRLAPYIAAGTNLLTGVARCGMGGCRSGLIIDSEKSWLYNYITCDNRVKEPRPVHTQGCARLFG
jgi:hypothetical protein